MGKATVLYELLDNHPSAILLGPSGTGKSTAHRILARALGLRLKPDSTDPTAVVVTEPVTSHRLGVHNQFAPSVAAAPAVASPLIFEDSDLGPLVTMINPASFTTEELFGALDPASGTWMDGVIPSLIRTHISDNDADGGPLIPKWIVLDSPITTN